MGIFEWAGGNFFKIPSLEYEECGSEKVGWRPSSTTFQRCDLGQVSSLCFNVLISKMGIILPLQGFGEDPTR